MWFLMFFTIVESITRFLNHLDMNRLATKVSLIVDLHNVPISCDFYPANKYDVTTIDSSFNNIPGRIKRCKSKLIHNLIGDKCYIVNTKNKVRKVKQHVFNIVTPYRSNQKQKTTSKEKILLQSRYKIENAFCRFKKV